ncbi:hypothetical protein [Caballeronia glathei]|uniref:hypothetical protein n=1 Tax=Caballeronia glathei TaxID=60547 RepID=UPI0019D3ED13|nr:hypothetical protein [Caballeronia glathei]
MDQTIVLTSLSQEGLSASASSHPYRLYCLGYPEYIHDALEVVGQYLKDHFGFNLRIPRQSEQGFHGKKNVEDGAVALVAALLPGEHQPDPARHQAEADWPEDRTTKREAGPTPMAQPSPLKVPISTPTVSEFFLDMLLMNGTEIIHAWTFDWELSTLAKRQTTLECLKRTWRE